MKPKEKNISDAYSTCLSTLGQYFPQKYLFICVYFVSKKRYRKVEGLFCLQHANKIRKNPVLSKTIVVEWPRCRGWGNCPCASAVHPCDRGAESLPRPCREVEVTNRNLRTEITKGKTNIAFEGLNRASTLKGKIKI